MKHTAPHLGNDKEGQRENSKSRWHEGRANHYWNIHKPAGEASGNDNIISVWLDNNSGVFQCACTVIHILNLVYSNSFNHMTRVTTDKISVNKCNQTSSKNVSVQLHGLQWDESNKEFHGSQYVSQMYMIPQYKCQGFVGKLHSPVCSYTLLPWGKKYVISTIFWKYSESIKKYLSHIIPMLRSILFLT